MGELTHRQDQVLALVALTGARRTVALALGISPETVKRHMHEAYIRLDATHLAEALMARGWLVLPDDLTR